MPEDVTDELSRSGLRHAYDSRPPYQRNDYLRWFKRAKLTATRRQRIEQMLSELERGDIYMKMPWTGER